MPQVNCKIKNKPSLAIAFSSKNKKGMTLIEVLLVVSLMSMISLSLYKALSNGLKVWAKSQDVVVEEDVSIFLDKIAHDLRNTYKHSLLSFEGSEYRIAFPTMITVTVGDYYVDTLGKVEYYFDFIDKGLFLKTATYGQALDENYSKPRLLIKEVNRINFRYFYQTKDGEISTDSAFETIPSGIEIEIQFLKDNQQRKITRFIDIPLQS